jgi:hypothetical protein
MSASPNATSSEFPPIDGVECELVRSFRRQTGELTVKFLKLLALDPSSKPRRFPQLFGAPGADAVTATIENDPLKASQRELFQPKLSATVIVQGLDFATVLHVIKPDQRG